MADAKTAPAYNIPPGWEEVPQDPNVGVGPNGEQYKFPGAAAVVAKQGVGAQPGMTWGRGAAIAGGVGAGALGLSGLYNYGKPIARGFANLAPATGRAVWAVGRGVAGLPARALGAIPTRQPASPITDLTQPTGGLQGGKLPVNGPREPFDPLARGAPPVTEQGIPPYSGPPAAEGPSPNFRQPPAPLPQPVTSEAAMATGEPIRLSGRALPLQLTGPAAAPEEWGAFENLARAERGLAPVAEGVAERGLAGRVLPKALGIGAGAAAALASIPAQAAMFGLEASTAGAPELPPEAQPGYQQGQQAAMMEKIRHIQAVDAAAGRSKPPDMSWPDYIAWRENARQATWERGAGYPTTPGFWDLFNPLGHYGGAENPVYGLPAYRARGAGG